LNSGFALRVLERVDEDAIICEYRGEVLTIDQSTKRMSKYKASDGFYFAALGNNLVLDACKMGSVARFANHSCDPNSYLQRWTVKGESRIVLTANEPLKAGTEVCYSYNFNDDGFSNNPIKSQKCHCGSPFCTGTVGGVSTMRHDINDTFHYCQRILAGEVKLSKQQIQKLVQDTEHIQKASKLVRDKMKSINRLIQQIESWQKEAEEMISFQDAPLSPTSFSTKKTGIYPQEVDLTTNVDRSFAAVFPFLTHSQVRPRKSGANSIARAWTIEDIELFLLQMPLCLKCDEEKSLRQKLTDAKKMESELLRLKQKLFSTEFGDEDAYFVQLKKWKERYSRQEEAESASIHNKKSKRGRKRRKKQSAISRKKINIEETVTKISEEGNFEDEMDESEDSDQEVGDSLDMSMNLDESNVIVEATSTTESCQSNSQPAVWSSTSSSEQTIKLDLSVHFSWTDCISLLRRVFAVLPIRCNHMDWLFTLLDRGDREIYQQWHHNQGDKRIEIPSILLNRYRVMFLQPKKSDQPHLYSDAMIVAQLWRHYGPLLPSSLAPLEDQVSLKLEKHWLFSFAAQEYLNEVLFHQELRQSSLLPLNLQYANRKVASSILQKQAFPSSADSKVYCFCRLPDTALVLSDLVQDSCAPPDEAAIQNGVVLCQQKLLLREAMQQTTMVQCDGCRDWFHPVCCAQRVQRSESGKRKNVVQRSNQNETSAKSASKTEHSFSVQNDAESSEWQGTELFENFSTSHCPTCILNMGELSDYVSFGKTKWDLLVKESMLCSSQTLPRISEVDFAETEPHVINMCVKELVSTISLEPLLQRQSNYLQQWHERALSFLKYEARHFFENWVQGIFTTSQDSASAGRVALIRHLFGNAESKLETDVKVKIVRGKEKDNKQRNNKTVTDKSAKKEKQKSEKNRNISRKSDVEAAEVVEPPLVIIFKRAAQLFLEPYFLIGEASLPKEFACTALNLRLILWILSTSSIWQIVYVQHRIHMFPQLVSPDSIFREHFLQQHQNIVINPVSEEDKLQITLSVLRKVAHGGTSLQEMVLHSLADPPSSHPKRLFSALYHDLRQLLKVTDTLIQGSKVLQSFPNSAMAADVVYGRHTLSSQQIQPSVSLLLDLMDLDGRSVLSGNFIIDDDELTEGIPHQKCPAAHYDIACLLSLAQQHVVTNAVDLKTCPTIEVQDGNVEKIPSEWTPMLYQLIDQFNSSQCVTEPNAIEEVFCWCRQPDDGAVPMLACDHCDEWYHAPCVRMSSRLRYHQQQLAEYSKMVKQLEKEIRLSRSHKDKNEDHSSFPAERELPAAPAEELPFVCIGCCLREHRPYPHAWKASSSS
jgi:hypothetical protein